MDMKMKRILVIVVAAAALLMAGAFVSFAIISQNPPARHENQKKDKTPTVNKTVEIGKFASVQVSNGLKVVLTPGAYTGRAEINTVPEEEKDLRVEVKSNQLRVYFKDRHRNGKVRTVVRVTAPGIVTGDVSSGATLVVTGPYTVKGNVTLSASSGGDIKADKITATQLNANASSAGDIVLSDLRGNLNANSSSGADIKITDVAGTDVTVTTSSGADAKFKSVRCDNLTLNSSSGADIKADAIDCTNLQATASSGADIVLKGRARNVNTSKSSGGSVKLTQTAK